MLSLGHSAIKRERDELQARITNAAERCNNLENRWKEATARNADCEATANRHVSELTQLRAINVNLQNEIDGLEIDKIHLKNELGVHREKQQKRREQKSAAMRRFRAKNKQAKNTTNK
jgi:chromosome segregation ATPase